MESNFCQITVLLLFLEKPIFPPSHKVVQLEWDIFAMLWVPLIRNFYKTFEVSQYGWKSIDIKISLYLNCGQQC